LGITVPAIGRPFVGYERRRKSMASADGRGGEGYLSGCPVIAQKRPRSDFSGLDGTSPSLRGFWAFLAAWLSPALGDRSGDRWSMCRDGLGMWACPLSGREPWRRLPLVFGLPLGFGFSSRFRSLILEMATAIAVAAIPIRNPITSRPISANPPGHAGRLPGGGERIKVRVFGAFSARSRPGRKARNPRTAEAVAVPDRRFVPFKPGLDLRRDVEEGSDGSAETGAACARESILLG